MAFFFDIIFSFCFLLWGLSAVASSVNLLVLKFMTISLEEVTIGKTEKSETLEATLKISPGATWGRRAE